ncbi:hypothetical protein DL93DRAFT_602532 [Clavulina sp. PMI_390]|nr:hypothetical protein DL93DRAFT_602532 [Clavulina sp. PMI_390]
MTARLIIEANLAHEGNEEVMIVTPEVRLSIVRLHTFSDRCYPSFLGSGRRDSHYERERTESGKRDYLDYGDPKFNGDSRRRSRTPPRGPAASAPKKTPKDDLEEGEISGPDSGSEPSRRNGGGSSGASPKEPEVPAKLHHSTRLSQAPQRSISPKAKMLKLLLSRRLRPSPALWITPLPLSTPKPPTRTSSPQQIMTLVKIDAKRMRGGHGTLLWKLLLTGQARCPTSLRYRLLKTIKRKRLRSRTTRMTSMICSQWTQISRKRRRKF